LRVETQRDAAGVACASPTKQARRTAALRWISTASPSRRVRGGVGSEGVSPPATALNAGASCAASDGNQQRVGMTPNEPICHHTMCRPRCRGSRDDLAMRRRRRHVQRTEAGSGHARSGPRYHKLQTAARSHSITATATGTLPACLPAVLRRSLRTRHRRRPPGRACRHQLRSATVTRTTSTARALLCGATRRSVAEQPFPPTLRGDLLPQTPSPPPRSSPRAAPPPCPLE